MKIKIKSINTDNMNMSTRIFKIKHFEFNETTSELDLQLDARGHMEGFLGKEVFLKIEDDVIREGDREVEKDVEERVYEISLSSKNGGHMDGMKNGYMDDDHREGTIELQVPLTIECVKKLGMMYFMS